MNEDPVKTFPLRQAAKAISEQLCKVIEGNKSKSLFGSSGRADAVHNYGADMVKGWSKATGSASDLALGNILPTASHIVAVQGSLVSHYDLN
jgi:hypothetical protein